jgi:hypothetical protein
MAFNGGQVIGNTGGEGGQDVLSKHDPFKKFGKHSAAIGAWYNSRNSRAGKNYTYWSRKGTEFDASSISSLAGSQGSKWSQGDWDNQIKSILAGETNVQWKDGVKYQQKSDSGWGSMFWEPSKGYETSLVDSVGEDGTIRKTAVTNEGFADYGSGWSRAGRAKKNYKAAKSYQKASQKNMDEFNLENPAAPTPAEQPGDAPSTAAGDAKSSNKSGARKTSDMTIGKRKKELGTPGSSGAGLGVSY